MTTAVGTSESAERSMLRRNAPAFFILGILMVAFGTFALGWSCLTALTVVAVWVFGVMLIIGGVAEFVTAVRGGRGHRLLHLVLGVLYLLVGGMFMNEPKDSAVRLTLIIAIFLMAGGLMRIVFALAERFPGRGAVLFNGVISLMLGIMIYRQWPVSGLWAIGLFLGVELLLNGWAWIALGIAARGKSQGESPATA